MTPRTCAICGASIPGGRGSCPRCLLELSRSPAPSEPSPERAPRERTPAPTPSELANDFPDFEILDLIGQGGMGCVYRARHRRLDRLVALKILAPGTEADARFEERFQREARALARLDHPGIVRVHDFGRAGRRWFLAMEFVEGTTLRELLRQGRVTSRAALDIVPQICGALQYAHDEGVVHRDIKPENVLVDTQGRVKIADFGLAKLVGPTEEIGARTRSDQAMGTLHYMAPEQATSARDVDHRADIYSLGVVFYEMLTGELPLGRFEPPSKRAHVDERLDKIVLKSLEPAPELRYQHAVEVGTDIADLTTSETGTPGDTNQTAASSDVADTGKVAGSVGSGAASSQAPHPEARRHGARRVGWFLATIVAWLVFWVSFGSSFALVTLPMVSVLALVGMRADVTPRTRAWRFGFAFVLHVLGCVAFAVDRVHRWETSASDYAPVHAWDEWRNLGATRAVDLAAEMIAMDPESVYRAQTVAATHTGWWPVFERGEPGLFAILLWLAAAVVLFAQWDRWSWREFVRPTLVLVAASTLAGWLAVERFAIGSAAQRVEIADRALAPLTIDRAAEVLERLAEGQRFGTRLVGRWKVVHERGWDCGQALQYVMEDEVPWRRWTFDVLHGPRRRTPRISVFVFELPGRVDARIEVNLGSVRTEPEERVTAWRALCAKMVDNLRPR